MGLESASYISQLVPTNPTGGDPKSSSDDHHRLTKTVLQTQFPNLGATAVTPTAADLNKVGITQSAASNDTSVASTAFVNTAISTQLTAIGAVTPNSITTFTNKTLTNPAINGFTGDTSAINIGSGQFVKDTSGNIGLGATPNYSLTSYRGGAVANYLQVVTGSTGAGAGNGLLVGLDASGNSVINTQGSFNQYTYLAGVLRSTYDTSGNFLLNSNGLGYGAGAGATATQPTSKTTTVTLNKPSGKITTNAAALSAGAIVQFQVVCSAVGVNDGVVLTFDNSATWAGQPSYSLRPAAVAAGGGSFFIALKNESGGSLSEALIINFEVIKGAVS